MLRTVTGSVASNVPAKIGNAAFFAPEILTVPLSWPHPLMSNLSKETQTSPVCC